MLVLTVIHRSLHSKFKCWKHRAVLFSFVLKKFHTMRWSLSTSLKEKRKWSPLFSAITRPPKNSLGLLSHRLISVWWADTLNVFWVAAWIVWSLLCEGGSSNRVCVLLHRCFCVGWKGSRVCVYMPVCIHRPADIEHPSMGLFIQQKTSCKYNNYLFLVF